MQEAEALILVHEVEINMSEARIGRTHSAAAVKVNSYVGSIDTLSLTAAALCPPPSLRMPNRVVSVKEIR